MSESVLLGQGRDMAELPRNTWEAHLSNVPQHTETRLSFMSEEHHRVLYSLSGNSRALGSQFNQNSCRVA